jgi:hypothetical protein
MKTVGNNPRECHQVAVPLREDSFGTAKGKLSQGDKIAFTARKDNFRTARKHLSQALNLSTNHNLLIFKQIETCAKPAYSGPRETFFRTAQSHSTCCK